MIPVCILSSLPQSVIFLPRLTSRAYLSSARPPSSTSTSRLFSRSFIRSFFSTASTSSAAPHRTSRGWTDNKTSAANNSSISLNCLLYAAWCCNIVPHSAHLSPNLQHNSPNSYHTELNWGSCSVVTTTPPIRFMLN